MIRLLMDRNRGSLTSFTGGVRDEFAKTLAGVWTCRRSVVRGPRVDRSPDVSGGAADARASRHPRRSMGDSTRRDSLRSEHLEIDRGDGGRVHLGTRKLRRAGLAGRLA